MNNSMLVFAEDSTTDGEQSLQHPTVCLWRVTGPENILLTSVMKLDPQTQSKTTEAEISGSFMICYFCWTQHFFPNQLNVLITRLAQALTCCCLLLPWQQMGAQHSGWCPTKEMVVHNPMGQTQNSGYRAEFLIILVSVGNLNPTSSLNDFSDEDMCWQREEEEWCLWGGAAVLLCSVSGRP